jgi:site-specific recombinase XerD
MTIGSIEKNLRKWIVNAVITRHMTFHAGRHTCAVMFLENSGDIYTLSKLHGHRDLATTEIYTKIVDKKKTEVIQNMPDFEF